jgi:hypothetical protein
MDKCTRFYVEKLQTKRQYDYNKEFLNLHLHGFFNDDFKLIGEMSAM